MTRLPGQPISVLFVCLGNICRSTMAEGIFRHLAQQPEYKDKIGEIDSCGTGESMQKAGYGHEYEYETESADDEVV